MGNTYTSCEQTVVIMAFKACDLLFTLRYALCHALEHVRIVSVPPCFKIIFFAFHLYIAYMFNLS